QRLGFADSRGLVPKAVRAIANHVLVQNAAVSIYAVEYAIRFNTCGLENDRYPERTDNPDDPNHIFTKYQGTLSEPWPDFEGLDGKIYDPQSADEIPVNLTLKDKQ
ncbi:DUF1834 family protein, partial [Neisseria meningitidis]|nr:DUF1834 family protein [Neisseria meningitidis]